MMATCKEPIYSMISKIITIIKYNGTSDTRPLKIFHISPTEVHYIANIGSPLLNVNPELISSLIAKQYQENYNLLIINKIKSLKLNNVIYDTIELKESVDIHLSNGRNTLSFYRICVTL